MILNHNIYSPYSILGVNFTPIDDIYWQIKGIRQVAFVEGKTYFGIAETNEYGEIDYMIAASPYIPFERRHPISLSEKEHMNIKIVSLISHYKLKN